MPLTRSVTSLVAKHSAYTCFMHCLGLTVYPAGHKRWGRAGELTLLGIRHFARAPLGSDVSKLRKQKFGYIFTFEFRVSKEAAERQ